MWVPPGHFYSPITSRKEIKRRSGLIWGKDVKKESGLNINDKAQISLLHKLAEFYKDLPFEAEKKAGLRYYYENNAYSYTDAIFLYSMIRHLRPKRIIEVGSGSSSTVILDTNELFHQNSIECTFIEPFPERLLSLITEKDRKEINLISADLQDVGLQVFSDLTAGDILFIDSTHVSKTGSDVNYIFFEILPSLKSGVYIHFHDIFYPFEYPKPWVLEGRSWNEAYMLRAFLQYNKEFRIALFSDYVHTFHRQWLRDNMPLCMKNSGGNIWIQKV